MKQVGLSFFTDTHLTIIALLLFFIVFTSVTIFVFRKDRKEIYERAAQLPLEDAKNE